MNRDSAILALVRKPDTSRWAWAAAWLRDEGIHLGEAHSKFLGGRPVDIESIFREIGASVDGVIDILLPMTGDPDEVEFDAVRLQSVYIDRIRVRGVSIVTTSAIMEMLALPAETDVATEAGLLEVLDRVNEGCNTSLCPEEFPMAWAISVLNTGWTGPWKVPEIFTLLPELLTPSSSRATSGPHAASPAQQLVAASSRSPRAGDNRGSELLTADELAAVLQISRSAAYHLSPRVPGCRIPGVGLRFRREDVEAFVQSSRRRTSGSPARRRFHPRGGMRLATGADDDDSEVMPGVTRKQLKERAGF